MGMHSSCEQVTEWEIRGSQASGETGLDAGRTSRTKKAAPPVDMQAGSSEAGGGEVEAW